MPSGRRETRSQSPESSKQRCTRARSTVCPAADILGNRDRQEMDVLEHGRDRVEHGVAVTRGEVDAV